MLQSKPSLADQNVILVFVIGGINGLEVKIPEFLVLFYLSFVPLSSLKIKVVILLSPKCYP